MDTPNNPTFWRPRADLIRECVAAGLPASEIRARCLAEGYEVSDKSFHQAVYSARKRAPRPPPARPSYYQLCQAFVREYENAYRAGKLLAVTREMKNLIDVMSSCLLADQLREPLTERRAKRKRKRDPR